MTAPADSDNAALQALALASPRVQEQLNGSAPKKVIVVPGKIGERGDVTTRMDGAKAMTTLELYAKTIRPLTADERLHIARLILEDLAPNQKNNPSQSEAGFDYLKRLLPQIERITLSDQDLASVTLDSSPRP